MECQRSNHVGHKAVKILTSMSEKDVMTVETKRLIETVREACLVAAMEAYEDASIRGLCAEGAWECAVGAIKSVTVESVTEKLKQT